MGNLKKLAAALIFASIALCGCSSEKSSLNSSSGMYRTEFTDQEKKNGHAKFDLMENVKVDADITPKSKYRRGLKKYYMDAYWETKNIKDIKDFEKNPCFFGKVSQKLWIFYQMRWATGLKMANLKRNFSMAMAN